MESQAQAEAAASAAHLETVEHEQNAAPGNVVSGPPAEIHTGNIGAHLPTHAGWPVAHPSEAGKYIKRSTFRLFVGNNPQDTTPAVTSSEKEGDGKHVLHPAIESAARSCRLKVECVAITPAGAELEFSK